MKTLWKLLSRFAQLPVAEKINGLKVGFVLILIKMALSCLPFDRFKTFFRLISKIPQKPISPKLPDTTINWIQKIGHHLPLGLTCLPQALALKFFLRNDAEACVIIGIENSPQTFSAHAWVEKDKKILIGQTPHPTYIPIWRWK
jgi:Transglutaminase-like superfamily